MSFFSWFGVLENIFMPQKHLYMSLFFYGFDSRIDASTDLTHIRKGHFALSFVLIWFVSLKMGSHLVAQDDLVFLILLHQPSKCWVCKSMPLIRQVWFFSFLLSQLPYPFIQQTKMYWVYIQKITLLGVKLLKFHTHTHTPISRSSRSTVICEVVKCFPSCSSSFQFLPVCLNYES